MSLIIYMKMVSKSVYSQHTRNITVVKLPWFVYRMIFFVLLTTIAVSFFYYLTCLPPLIDSSKKAAIPLWYLGLSISMVQLISEGPYAVCENRRNFIYRTGTDLWCTPGVCFRAPLVCTLHRSGWRYHRQAWSVLSSICR